MGVSIFIPQMILVLVQALCSNSPAGISSLETAQNPCNPQQTQTESSFAVVRRQHARNRGEVLLRSARYILLFFLGHQVVGDY